jgi:hypothetical protein
MTEQLPQWLRYLLTEAHYTLDQDDLRPVWLAEALSWIEQDELTRAREVVEDAMRNAGNLDTPRPT